MSEYETTEEREMDVNYRRDRLGLISEVLLGLAIVTVILGIVAAIWFAVDRDRQKALRFEQLRQQTAQECIHAGNVWVDGQSCVVVRPL
jgi:hypothetical protein